MVTRPRLLSREANEVRPKEDFQSHVIKTDIVTDLLEEENHTTIEMRTGLTEIQVTDVYKRQTVTPATGKIGIFLLLSLNSPKIFSAITEFSLPVSISVL